MAVAFQGLIVRSPSRLRLRFSNTLDSGAFSPSWFAIVCLDGSGADPAVNAALEIDDAPNEVELVIATELTPGGLYEITVAAGVPATDASTTVESSQEFTAPATPPAPSPSVQQSDLLASVYGVDLYHNGVDFVRAASGDLETLSGPANVQAALLRRLESEGLPYAPEYGGHAREFVDAPSPGLPLARGRLEAECRQDLRVRGAQVDIVRNENDGTVYLNLDVQLIGAVAVNARERL